MTDAPQRAPDQSRQDCARKRRSVENSRRLTTALSCLLGRDRGEPHLEERRLTTDRCRRARVEGEASSKALLGHRAVLIRTVHGVAEVAGSDLWLLGLRATITITP
jgi:hypothetical protein